MNEIWKDVPGFGGHYQASNIGRVKAKQRLVKKRHSSGKVMTQIYPEKILAPTLDNGYYRVHIGIDKTKHFVAVHRLVLLAFKGHPPPDTEGCHTNGNSMDNNINNLRWDTHFQNNQDRKKHGRYASGFAHPMSKFTQQQIDIAKTAKTLKEAMFLSGMTKSTAIRYRNVA